MKSNKNYRSRSILEIKSSEMFQSAQWMHDFKRYCTFSSVKRLLNISKYSSFKTSHWCVSHMGSSLSWDPSTKGSNKWDSLPACQGHLKVQCDGTVRDCTYTVKPVLRNHSHDRSPDLKDWTCPGEMSYISMSLNLCNQRPSILGDHIYSQM